jgi:putative DNA primase/helicase
VHEYSAGDERYTISKTDEYLDRAKEFGSPITCAHFREHNPDGCVGCPASGRITSPVELGRMAQPDKQPKETSGSAGLHGESIRLPPDFKLDAEDRLVWVSENKKGDPVYDLICPFPVYLKSVQTEELDKSEFGYVFRIRRPRAGWTDVVVPANKAVGNDRVAHMAKKGITIYQADGWKIYVQQAAGLCEMNNGTETRFDQFGWKNEDTEFLIGRRLYTSAGIKEVNGNDTLQQRARYFDGPRSRNASLERWQRAANKMFAKGFEHQSLAILCGFAAPLMRFHSEGEGGAIVSFISDKTNSGKTTALEAAASVWGDHRGLKLDDSDTRVAKGLKLGILGNLPCTFDELYERDPEEIRKFVIAFTNGMDKDRGTVDGGLRVNKADWQTILLLSSNKSIVDALSNLDASDAPAARVFELSTALPPGSNEDDFDKARRELNHNHGFAGHEYMKALMQPGHVNEIKENIPRYTKIVRKAAQLEAKHRFWTRMIVSVLIAGTIVQRIGLLEFDIKRIRDWLLQTAQDQRDQVVDSSEDDCANALATFIDTHFDHTLVVDGNKPGVYGKPVIMMHEPKSGKPLIRIERENQFMLIAKTELNKWLTDKSIGVSHFVKTLMEQRVIVNDGHKHTLGAGTVYSGAQTPCYKINLANPALTGAVTLTLVKSD